MRPARAPVFALVALLVVAAMGCPCVWAQGFAASVHDVDAATRAATDAPRGEASCPCCRYCDREQAHEGDEPTPTPDAPGCPCARRAHGEGMAPETTIDLAPPATLALAIPLLIPAELTLVGPQAIDTHHDEGPPGPRPPDEARRGVVLRN
ncbi:MAG: hypothetical protein AB7T63_14040 [Planctomycetota bacterium]